MIKRIWYILMLVLCGSVNVFAEGIANDTLSVPTKKKWYTQISEYRKLSGDSVAVDSFKTEYGKQYWMLAAAAAKLNLADETIEYPRFVQFCVDVYNWGDRTFGTYDPEYVVGTGKKWKLQIENDNWYDFYHLKQPGGLKMAMASDVAPNLGISLSYMAVSVGYSVNVDKFFSGEPVKHKRWDFNFNCALLALDAYYTNNTGNTNIHKLNDYHNYNIFKSDYKFSGLSVESYGIDAYYFFNNMKYSQAAAYGYSKLQKKSAGSFIAGVTLSHQNVDIDFNTLPEVFLNKLPDERRKYHIHYNDYSVMLGYGYNWAFKKNWLLNATVMPAFGFNHSLSATDVKAYRKDKFGMSVKAKFALVYNHNRFYYSINGKYDGHFYSTKEYQFINSYSNLAILAGFRF